MCKIEVRPSVRPSALVRPSIRPDSSELVQTRRIRPVSSARQSVRPFVRSWGEREREREAERGGERERETYAHAWCLYAKEGERVGGNE